MHLRLVRRHKFPKYRERNLPSRNYWIFRDAHIANTDFVPAFHHHPVRNVEMHDPDGIAVLGTPSTVQRYVCVNNRTPRNHETRWIAPEGPTIAYSEYPDRDRGT